MKLKTPEVYYPIGIIIPTTSNKTNYKTLNDACFFNIMLPSFLDKYNKRGKYIYNFYIAYDDDDTFFLKYHDAMIQKFNDMTPDNFTLKLYTVSNMKNKVGHIWNFLADKAYGENEYIYQLGDDIQIIDAGWEKVFINVLKKQNNVGVTGPRDINNHNILTQSFIHKTHIDIFGYYFHPEIINWYIDNWITGVYDSKFISNIKIFNTSIENQKYDIVCDIDNYKKCVEEGKKILEKWKNKKYLLSIGIPTLTKRKKLLDRLLNKIKIISSKYKDLIELVILTDSGGKTTGYKRNEILNRAKGKYICFIDDDDLISNNYFDKIIPLLQKDYDGVGFKGMYYENGKETMIFDHNHANGGHFKKNNIQYRPLNHLNPIKLSIAKQIKYPDKYTGEDYEWTNKLFKSGLIKSTVHIDQILYHYLYNSNK